MTLLHADFCQPGDVFFDRDRADAGDGIFRALAPLPPTGWTSATEGVWRHLRPIGSTLPEQGWKVHVAGTPATAERVLTMAHAWCVARGITYKHLRSPRAVLRSNGKYAARASSGKFLTLYPADDEQLADILDGLGAQLDGTPGPYILSDLRIGAGPLHVRYGGFRRLEVDDGETARPAIRTPSGALVPDSRRPGFRVPEWVTPPAVLARHLAARSGTALPWHITAALHFSNGGGVYRATSPAGTALLVKEARPYAGLDAHGTDAVARIRREHAALTALAGIPGLPAVHGLHAIWEHLFLARAYVPGTSLNRWLARHYPVAAEATDAELATYRTRAMAVADRLDTLVAQVHARGWVVGDLHPGNVLIGDDDTLTLIDLELASETAAAESPGMAAAGFAAPAGLPGPARDSYALAAIRLWLLLPLAPMAEIAPATTGAHLAYASRRFALGPALTGALRTNLRVPHQIFPPPPFAAPSVPSSVFPAAEPTPPPVPPVPAPPRPEPGSRHPCPFPAAPDPHSSPATHDSPVGKSRGSAARLGPFEVEGQRGSPQKAETLPRPGPATGPALASGAGTRPKIGLEAADASEPGAAPGSPGEWPVLRAALIRAIEASATPGRDDRLFPGDPEQFASGGLGLGHGAAGVLYALWQAGAPCAPEHVAWLREHARTAPPRPGLWTGGHGVAYVLDLLGHPDEADALLRRCAPPSDRPLLPGLAGGASGIALTLAALGAARADQELVTRAAHLAGRIAALPAEAAPAPGLMTGWTGPALLFLHLYELTADPIWLTHADTALSRDLTAAVTAPSGGLHLRDGRRTLPYLDRGTAGPLLAAAHLARHRPDAASVSALPGLVDGCRQGFVIYPGLLAGRAGLAVALSTGGADADAAAAFAGLSLYAVPYAGGTAFPGVTLRRLSMDLHTGTAGILLALTHWHERCAPLPLLLPPPATGRALAGRGPNTKENP